MDPAIRAALDRGHTIDITTTGRRSTSRAASRSCSTTSIGTCIISGMPSRRTRAWIHNLEDDPNLTVHLKDRTATADLPATARIITDEPERRAVMPHIARNWGRTDVDTMVAYSPLIEVTVPGYPD